MDAQTSPREERSGKRSALVGDRSRRRVVVTGMGIVSPLGLDLSSTWKGIRAGRSGVRRIQSFDPRPYETQIAAEVSPRWTTERWVRHGGRRVHRKTAFALRACREAIRRAGLQAKSQALETAAVVFGSEVCRPDFAAHRVGRAGLADWPIDYFNHAAHVTTSEVAREIGAAGPAINLSLACSSSAAAVAEAIEMIRSGSVEVAIAGGADSQIDPLGLSLFGILGVLSTHNRVPTRASRPFDSSRDGFVMGEGAAALVVESLDHARARSAPMLAELLGFGISANAYRITDTPPNGEGPAEAMQEALEDGNLRPSEIDYINAHGTATADNDRSEARAIRRVLGNHVAKGAVSSTKSMIGHLIAAAGAIELAFSVCAIQDGLAPPTVNLETPDPECRLDHVGPRARRMPIRNVLSNSFAFGGTNVSLAVGRMAS